MTTIPSAQEPRMARLGSSAGLFGAALAVSVCLTEVIFFCAYLIFLPFMVILALIEIPLVLRKHIEIR